VKCEKTGCWLWTKCRNQDGYGHIGMNGHTVSAHRVAAYLFLGYEFDSKRCVLHRCDNPPCCNPNHLFIGTQADNVRDMAQKKRLVAPRGEKCHFTHLRDDDVIMIRKAFQRGEKLSVLAEQYGMIPNSISRIVNGKHWTYLPLFPRRNGRA
jgi:hypothetical protein